MPESRILIRLLRTHANYGSIYAGLLVARVTSDTVNLRINDGSTPCTLMYAVFGG